MSGGKYKFYEADVVFELRGLNGVTCNAGRVYRSWIALRYIQATSSVRIDTWPDVVNLRVLGQWY